jgi:hypothetical protein
VTPRDFGHRWLGGWAGVIGIVVPTIGLVIFPLWRFPPTTATDAQVGEFVAAHSVALQAMMVCYTIGVTLWLLFGACVWAMLRERCDVKSAVPTSFAAGLVSFVTLLLAGFTAFNVLVYRGSEPGNSRLLYDLTFGLLAMSGLPTALCLGAFAAAVYAGKALPAYTAHVAAAGAVGHVLLLLSFIVPTGFFSLEGAVIIVVPGLLWIWILVTGIELLRSPARQPPG